MTTFALSWPLTWFCHVIDNLQDVSRVFDVCLASHPFTVLYISAAVIVSRRDAVLGGQCSMDVVYHTLCQLPPERSVEQLVALGLQYQRAHPLYSLLYLPSLSTAEVQMLAKWCASLLFPCKLLRFGARLTASMTLTRHQTPCSLHALPSPPQSRRDAIRRLFAANQTASERLGGFPRLRLSSHSFPADRNGRRLRSCRRRVGGLDDHVVRMGTRGDRHGTVDEANRQSAGWPR